jgi:hypothetical protein
MMFFVLDNKNKALDVRNGSTAAPSDPHHTAVVSPRNVYPIHTPLLQPCLCCRTAAALQCSCLGADKAMRRIFDLNPWPRGPAPLPMAARQTWNANDMEITMLPLANRLLSQRLPPPPLTTYPPLHPLQLGRSKGHEGRGKVEEVEEGPGQAPPPRYAPVQAAGPSCCGARPPARHLRPTRAADPFWGVL